MSSVVSFFRRFLTTPQLPLRGWSVGLGVGIVLVVATLRGLPLLIEQHEWLIWVPVLIAAWVGARSWEHPNPSSALLTDAGRVIVAGLCLAAAIAAWIFLPPIIESVFDGVTPTGLDGLSRLTVIGFGITAWMLFGLGRAIERLGARLDALNETLRPREVDDDWDDDD